MSGILFIISGPSGAGKTTLALFVSNVFKDDLMLIPTYTTRLKRAYEKDGIDYNFVTEEEFFKLKNENFFIETVCIDSNQYGSQIDIINKLKSGKNLIIVVNREGMIFFNKIYKNTCNIWIDCIDQETLKERIINRNFNDKDDKIESRIKVGIYERECEKKNPKSNFLIVNDLLDESKNAIQKVFFDKLKKINKNFKKMY